MYHPAHTHTHTLFIITITTLVHSLWLPLLLPGVGFIADYNKDGFASGSPTKYSGDYFIPGTPLEGWSVDLKTSTGSGYTRWLCKGRTGKKDITPDVFDGTH